MKTRNGFVSNSSTTSFCIFGSAIDEEECAKLIREKYSQDAKFEDGENDDIIDEWANHAGLELHYGYDRCEAYLGRSWSSVQDDETGRAFKESVQKALKDLLGKEIKCETIVEAFRDG